MTHYSNYIGPVPQAQRPPAAAVGVPTLVDPFNNAAQAVKAIKAIAGLGDTTTDINKNAQTTASAIGAVWLAASTAGLAAGAYHGYKRNDSVGWAVGWALLGSMFPFITIPVSFAQGFGKRAR